MSPHNLAQAAVAQAIAAVAHLVNETDESLPCAPLGDGTVEQLADALKMTIEAAQLAGQVDDDEYGKALDQLRSMLAAFLEGWA